MTEDEAKTKWCPFARVGFYSPATMHYPAEHALLGNREAADGALQPASLCIGSACMAWREREPQIERRQTGLGRMPVEPYERYVQEGWRQVDRPPGEEGLFYERTISPGGGFCGLAGEPS